ncbi:MAG: sensor histidine kinase [Planctomycetota bacterium]
MISIEYALKVLKNHIRVSMKTVPCGIEIGIGNIPTYICEQHGLPPACRESQKHSVTRSICAKFYKSLDSNEGEAICPFGTNILYLKTDDTSKPVGFFIQTGFSPRFVSIDTIRSLSRVPKKAMKNALEETRKFSFCSTNESKTLNLLKRTLETLFAGRVAASMRILTHEILTPVHGAMNDIEEIKWKQKQDGYEGNQKSLNLLDSNIDEINSVAKQIHILLSEDIEPSRPRIRKVTVHNVIKRRCDRLESVATKKDLQFHNHFNKGIKVVEAVPDQLVIVFRCLLDNAAKYSFSGSTNRKRTIDIRYADIYMESIRTLKVEIENYGCPISEDEIRERKIFKLGYRGDFSGDRGRQGTGSGLYIAERIVGAHSGKIDVTSRAVELSEEGIPEQAINKFTVYWPKSFQG